MKTLIKKLFPIILVPLISQNAIAADISVSLNEGAGNISGIVTKDGKFRITDLSDNSERAFTLKGDMLKDSSLADFKDSCERAYDKFPDVLKRSSESLIVSGVIFPYTQSAISKAVGLPTETAIAVTALEPVIGLAANAVSRKAYRVESAEAFSRFVQQKMNIKMDQVAKGAEVDMNFTGLGPLVCDLVMGRATLKFTIGVSRESALPTVFAPVTADDVRSISNVLLASNSWNLGSVRNAVLAGRVIESELQKKKEFRINNSNETGKLYWTVGSFTNFVQEFLEGNTSKPKALSTDQAAHIAKLYTVSEYGTEFQAVFLTATFKGSRK